MFSFRPRKPMLGGKLNKKRKAEAEAEEAAALAALPPGVKPPKKKKKKGPLEPLRDGGPVERAIRADLDNLKALFDEVNGEASSSSAVSAPDHDEHDDEGSNFLRFKEAFRRGKFGIMHTRCIPPRCDRAEFAQMVYSACLGMLMDSLNGVGPQGDGSGSDGSDSGSPNGNKSNAIFALFALYTLHETCPLPEFPSPYHQETSNVQNSSSIGTEVFSEQERAALTTLPLGITGAGEQSRVIYRRAYKSPIRVGLEDYGRIVQLQDLCLECKSQCEYRRAESFLRKSRDDVLGGKEGRSSNGNSDDDEVKDGHWKCQCGMAGDCLEIIDRLQSNDSFDYCEYAGPCSVEGLAGSANYFDKVVDPPAKAPKRAAQNAAILTNEGLPEHAPVDIAAALDIGGLEAAYANYQTAFESIKTAPQLQGDSSTRRGQQSNQTLQIQETLRPVLLAREKESDEAKSIERLTAIRNKFKSGESVPPVDGWQPTDDRDDEASDADTRGKSIWDQVKRFQGTEDATGSNGERNDMRNGEGMEVRAQVQMLKPTVQFNLPRGISKSLERGIKSALVDIGSDLQRARETELFGAPPNIAVGRGDVQRLVDISMELLGEENFDVAEDEDEIETIITHHTGHSTIPPMGAANALRDLLSCARESDDEDDGGSTGGDNEDLVDDDASMVSAPSTAGRGGNALDALLSQVQSKSSKKSPKQQTAKRKPRKRAKQSEDNDDPIGDDIAKSSAPSAAGRGGGALDALLSRVQPKSSSARKKSPKQQSKKLMPRKKEK